MDSTTDKTIKKKLKAFVEENEGIESEHWGSRAKDREKQISSIKEPIFFLFSTFFRPFYTEANPTTRQT